MSLFDDLMEIPLSLFEKNEKYLIFIIIGLVILAIIILRK